MSRQLADWPRAITVGLENDNASVTFTPAPLLVLKVHYVLRRLSYPVLRAR
jgi:hypothetical protein